MWFNKSTWRERDVFPVIWCQLFELALEQEGGFVSSQLLMDRFIQSKRGKGLAQAAINRTCGHNPRYGEWYTAQVVGNMVARFSAAWTTGRLSQYHPHIHKFVRRKHMRQSYAVYPSVRNASKYAYLVDWDVAQHKGLSLEQIFGLD